MDATCENGRVWIDGKSKIAETDSDFICATMDWWPPEKCDYGTCSWGHSSLLNVVTFSFLFSTYLWLDNQFFECLTNVTC